jgi:hypothetical protein
LRARFFEVERGLAEQDVHAPGRERPRHPRALGAPHFRRVPAHLTRAQAADHEQLVALGAPGQGGLDRGGDVARDQGLGIDLQATFGPFARPCAEGVRRGPLAARVEVALVHGLDLFAAGVSENLDATGLAQEVALDVEAAGQQLAADAAVAEQRAGTGSRGSGQGRR